MQYAEKNEEDFGLNITDIWEVDKKTFKNKACVLFGDNGSHLEKKLAFEGAMVKADSISYCGYKTIFAGKRSAWTCNPKAKNLKRVLSPICLQEGADIMYRTMIFFQAEQQPNGKWKLQSVDKRDKELGYLLNDVHKYIDFSVSVTNICDQFMYKCYLSKHLVQFAMDKPADAFLPVFRNTEGWSPATMEECVALGMSTADLVEKILKKGGFYNLSDYYRKKLNYRNKLEPQVFEKGTYLVVSSAGGTYPCSAYIRIEEGQEKKIIVDQTLYWTVVTKEEEAIYLTGMLNSPVVSDIIKEFQPEGIMGQRHIHTIPFDVTPQYDSKSNLHKEVVRATKALIQEIREKMEFQELVKNRSITLQKRRKYIRSMMKIADTYWKYVKVCGDVFGIEG